jgi:hypothetical protein
MAEEYHYPPELFELLAQTIPLLVKGKKDVLTFFKGAGVEPALMTGVTRRVNQDKVGEFVISRDMIYLITPNGDTHEIIDTERYFEEDKEE